MEASGHSSRGLSLQRTRRGSRQLHCSINGSTKLHDRNLGLNWVNVPLPARTRKLTVDRSHILVIVIVAILTALFFRSNLKQRRGLKIIENTVSQRLKTFMVVIGLKAPYAI